MTNEVEITITADDLTGPAFASVMRRLAALKAAARDANSEFGSIGLSDFSLSRMNSSLTALKAKIQSLGIADIADVNVPTGRLMTQMQLLKRLIQQAGISDLMDINANTAGLMSQLSKLRGLTEEVPVRYFVQGGPGAGPPSLISADITDRFSVMGLAVADQQLAALSNISAQLSKTVNTEAVPAAYALGRGWGWAGNAFALAGTKLKLFGGNLGAIPLLGSITGFHLLADAVFEVGAVVIPAAVGLAAFGAASIPTFQGVYQQMSNLNTVSSALGVNLPGVSGGFQSISDAVQPKALQLFGDALYIANQRSDLFRRGGQDRIHSAET